MTQFTHNVEGSRASQFVITLFSAAVVILAGALTIAQFAVV